VNEPSQAKAAADPYPGTAPPKWRLAVPRWRTIIVSLVGLAGLALGGRHLWAWHHFRAGQQALDHYHAREALSHFEACLRVWSSRPDVHLLAARAARQSERFDQAQGFLDACQSLQEKRSPEDVLEWALLQAARGDLAGVEEVLLRRADTDHEHAPLIWEALVEGYRVMYRLLDARSCLDRWLAAQPDNVQAHAQYGRLWRQMGALQKASDSYRRALELDPTRDDDRLALAHCLSGIGRFAEALEHFTYLNRVRPEDPELLIAIGLCHLDLGQLEEAQRVLDDVLAKNPENPGALLQRGRLALAQRRPAEAEEWFRKTVAVAPMVYLPNWLLFQALQEQGKTTEANEQAARVAEIKDLEERLADVSRRRMSVRPFDPSLHYEMGILKLRQGDKTGAESWLLSALRLDPHLASAHAALADFYQKQGDDEKAAFHRSQAAGSPPAR